MKYFLILMSVIAVISDSLLHPFYPQYLAKVFQVTSTAQVGYYIAASSFTVMLTFPIWAKLAQTYSVLRLLILTQAVTAVLNFLCYGIKDYLLFWIVSMLALAFKSSYLLIYPYVMSLETKDDHLQTIGLLAFVVYFGNIMAATLSGFIFQSLAPEALFLVMAVGDVVQIGICLVLAKMNVFVPEEPRQNVPDSMPTAFLFKLGIVMFVLYLSAYLTEPFFSLYWENLAASENKIIAGVVFAIPGIAALMGLIYNATLGKKTSSSTDITWAIALGLGGILLQTTAMVPWVLLGRLIYGWALFQTMVRLDLQMFQLSRPETYAADFSKINLFQALGIQAASFLAGSLVSFGFKMPFLAAAGGFIVGGICYAFMFRNPVWGVSCKSPSSTT